MNRILVLLAVSLLLFAGCVEDTSPSAPSAPSGPAVPSEPTVPSAPENQTTLEPSKETVKVGVALPLSGDAAPYGVAAKKGVELALEKINSEGLITGKELSIVYEDSKCSGTDGVTSMQKLATVDNVIAVVGEMCSSATVPMVPIADQNKVLMVSPASTAPTLSGSSKYFFRTVPSDELQGREAAKLLDSLGYSRVAILYVNDDYGTGFEGVLSREFEALGGTVSASEAFSKEATDLKTQLLKIKITNPDSLFVISNAPTPAGLSLKQAKELSMDVQMFGSEGLKDKSVVDAAKGGAEGILVTYMESPSESTVYQEFVAAHKTKYNEEPGVFAAESYDALMAIAMSLENSDGTTEGLINAMQGLSFDGASGKIDFDQKGDVVKDYAVFQVVNGEFVSYGK